ncbi:hypothetical protein GQ53DRAFT_382109 [Thozetella sp. PMI_491]|nr:hypothetical protein GQ53DRAFT_382109 [Thozetella sp. PMI_491]
MSLLCMDFRKKKLKMSDGHELPPHQPQRQLMQLVPSPVPDAGGRGKRSTFFIPPPFSLRRQQAYRPPSRPGIRGTRGEQNARVGITLAVLLQPQERSKKAPAAPAGITTPPPPWLPTSSLVRALRPHLEEDNVWGSVSPRFCIPNPTSSALPTRAKAPLLWLLRKQAPKATSARTTTTTTAHKPWAWGRGECG